MKIAVSTVEPRLNRKVFPAAISRYLIVHRQGVEWAKAQRPSLSLLAHALQTAMQHENLTA